MNAMELSARLSLDASNFNKGMQNAESGFKSFGNRLKSIGGAMVKTVVAGAAAATAAFVAVGKRSIDAYANYEQLTGGIETLFKTSAKTMMKYADQAYKTSGVSANKYMEMSTSFAASLISGLGGDTAKAADMANMAIVDMSDNANKMGTDLAMIQNAYQGFAKQNYTMLDNLKLGYGGTKTEMERLLADASKLTGKKFNVSNFADIVQAIHAIQTQMDITGTTSKEASTTISGSMNMVKAAWEDMLVEMSKPQEASKGFMFMQDESEATAKAITKGPQAATQKFISSVKTMLGNVLPAVRNFISNFGDVVAAIAPMIGEELPQLLADFLPKFFEAGKNLVVGIGRGITKAFQTFKWPTWKEVQAGAQKAWQGIQKGVETLGGLIFGTDPDTGSIKWPTWKDVGKFAENAWNTIVEGVKGLGKIVFGDNVDITIGWPTWGEIGSAITDAWNAIIAGVNSLGKIVFGTKVDGTVDWPTWDKVNAVVTDGWNAIVAGVNSLGKIVFGEKVDGTVDWPTWDKASGIVTEGWNAIVAGVGQLARVVFGEKVDGTIDWPSWDSVSATVTEGWNAIVAGVGGLAKIIFGTKVDGTINWPTWDTVSDAATQAWNTIVAGAADLKGLVMGDVPAVKVFDDLLTSWNTLHDTIVEKTIDIGKRFFGNADPTVVSTAIKGIGDAIIPLAAGLATAGFIANFGKFIEGIKKLFDVGMKDTNWVAIAIGAIATLATYIMQNWDDFGPKFEAIGGWITDNIITPVSTAISKIQDIINKVKEFLGLGGNEPSGAVLSEEQIGGIQKAFENWQEVSKWDFEEGFKAFDKFKETLKSAMTEAGFSNKEIENTFKGIEDALNKGDVAGIQNIISNLNSTSGAAQAAEDAVNAVKEAAEAAAGDYNINFNVTTTGTIPNTLYAPAGGGIAPTRPRGIKKAKGDWNIPYDNYPAILHRDEMVLTASQARQYREGQNSGIDAATLASAMRSAVLDLTMEFNGREVGRMFGDSTTARVNRNIGQINRRRRYGYGG